MTSKMIGVISDTHGLLRPQAYKNLQGCDVIIHAGDIGSPEVLKELDTIAPVIKVKGNVDVKVWAEHLPLTEVLEIGETFIYILHDLGQLDLVPEKAGINVVISGHSHKPKIEDKNGVLYINPGSAGPKRFNLPVCLARLKIDAKNEIKAEIIDLIANL